MQNCKAPLGRVNTGFKATSRPSNVGQVVAFRAFTPAADSKGYAPNRPEVAPLGGSRRMGGPRAGLGGTPRLAAPTRMVGGASLDTSELLTHPPHQQAGEAQEVKGLTALQKRARRKAYAKGLALALANVTTDSGMAKGYRSTAYVCGEQLHQMDGRLVQSWCGRRWCAACSAIRTARAITAYCPQVEAWPAGECQLVTLTVPNVPGEALRETLQAMHKAFGTIMRSRPMRRVSAQVEALRATECTYSEVRGDYHPHIHTLVRGQAVAAELVRQWLSHWPAALEKAQDIRQADRAAMREVFKYSTKLASDKRDADGTRRIVPPFALDRMFQAMRGLRLWQAVGLRAANADDAAADDTAALAQDVGTPAPKRSGEALTWYWCQDAKDWTDPTTGEALSEYVPGRAARLFLEKLAALGPAKAQLRPPPQPPESMPATLGTGTAQPARQSAAYPAAPHPADTSRYLGNKGTCYVHRTSSHLMAACLGDLGAPLPARVARPAVTPAASRSDNPITPPTMGQPSHEKKDTHPQPPPALIPSAA